MGGRDFELWIPPWAGGFTVDRLVQPTELADENGDG
jgi:hypothetical protein